MIKLNLDIEELEKKEQFEIPDSWDDVTVEQFANIFALNKKELTDIEKSVEIISILSGIEKDYIYMMSPDEFKKIGEVIEFTNKDVEGNQVDSITVDDCVYYLKSDFDNLTMGEVISLELLLKESGGQMLSMMPELLCIFLRKKKDNGKLEAFKKSFMERSEIFKKISITDVNNIFLFFSDGENLSTSNMKESLESRKVEAIRRSEIDSKI